VGKKREGKRRKKKRNVPFFTWRGGEKEECSLSVSAVKIVPLTRYHRGKKGKNRLLSLNKKRKGKRRTELSSEAAVAVREGGRNVFNSSSHRGGKGKRKKK